ncbi:MAG: amino acid adenylation domain-containing protein [Gammaproteobacteria bacterium]|nr:amino acid adenylation domain-containing protein [Gammaproteobacteria bacterium]
MQIREKFDAEPGAHEPSALVAPLAASEKKLKFPCSSGQQRFWLLHQLNPRNPSLNVAVRWRLEGAVINSELEQAFRLIMSRHSVLRTYFTETDGQITQTVESKVFFHIPIIDLTGLSETQASLEAERIARLETCTPFELSAPPLMRVTHVRLSKNVSILLVTLHHIVADARSIGILAREMKDICTAFHARSQPCLPALPFSYGDFSAWQAEQLIKLSQQQDIDFWKRTLDAFKHFEIQTDHPRPSMLTANGSVLSIALDKELIDELTDLAQHAGVTLQMTIVTALFILLHRYTGETDICIGSEFTSRDDADFENLIGLFSHMLVLRNDVAGDPSFLALLARTQDKFAEVLKHLHITPENLIDIVKPKPDLSRNPLYSVNLEFKRSFIQNDNASGFKLIELPSYSAGTVCDLNFSVVESPHGWSMACEYNLDLFESQTILRLLKHFKILLQSTVTAPQRKISCLTLLDESERRELVVERNRTSAIYPKHLTLPQLFEAQARRTPDDVALICGEHSLTYRELDMASNRLAHELRRRGVEPGNRVAIFLDRTPELIVTLLAVLKCGGAYIPLDPVYPPERLQHIFENSRPAAIVTREILRQRLIHQAMAVILVDAQSALIAKQSAEPLAPSASPTDAAYIIYTSGSTGQPKGVAVHHRALVNLLCAMRRQPGLTQKDTMVGVTTVSFDLAVPDLFLPLIVGAKLVLAQEQEMADGVALFALLQRHNVSVMQATPVTWQLLLEAGWHGHPPLKMLCGGEAMPRKLAERLLKCGGELWNMYGPTETTVWSSAQRVESGEGAVAIGAPLSNTQFYILDSHQELVPRGVPGELFIGGDGVALGYFDLPTVTAEKFVADKFRKLADAKLYRTGDTVRMLANGQIEYLGRSDHQIKLRGFRIELGEIEAALLRHADIAEAVVILGHEASGEDAIWAYVVPRRGDATNAADLIGALQKNLTQALPHYMCPSSVTILDALPRTPNGKLNRRALPVPAPTARVTNKEPMQPQNEVERQLAKIWSSVLGVEVIDKAADFFELGGHSLLAARLLSRIEAVFGQRLSLLSLFKAPTIQDQAKILMQSGQREYDFRQVVRLQPNGSKPPLIAIHNTGVYYYNLSKYLGSDQPLTALQIFDPSIKRASLPHTLEEIAAEYVQLIRQFQIDGPYKLVGWCVGGVLAFEVARQLVQAGQEVSLLAMIDTWAPGHNERLPKWRAALADYSYRWQLIGTDWRRVLSHAKSLAAFFKERVLFQKIRRWFVPASVVTPLLSTSAPRDLSAENYDQWLLGYLENCARNYEPKLYPGKITLLCSALEPRGLFLDAHMGWDAFALGGVDVSIIDGDHFTVFKGKGLEQMAGHITRAMDVYRIKRHPLMYA